MKTKNSRPSLFLILLMAAICCGIFPATANAWGSKGHQIIARIAADQLSSQARRNVAKLLNGASLESVAAWADLNGRAHTLPHLLPLPDGANTFNPDADCPKEKDCLIRALNNYHKVLGNPKNSTKDRTEALKYLIHYIGDLHQPFHCIKNDRNGRDKKVTFNKKSTDLHSVWDSQVIDKSQMTAAQYARQLGSSRTVAFQSFDVFQGWFIDWALESNRVARKAYDNASGDLADNSVQKTMVDQQLYKAGLRLGKILNLLFS